MSSASFATSGDGSLTISGSESPTVLLIDSTSETISAKRVTVHKNPLLRLWQRAKSLHEIQAANPACAVYWCSLDKMTGYLCVSDLSLHTDAERELASYVAKSKRLKFVCSQLMSIGYDLPLRHKSTLLVVQGIDSVRHVYLIDHKPVFIRLLPINGSTVDYMEPLEATIQHLINRGMSDGEPSILCHGLSESVLLVIKDKCTMGTVGLLSSDTSALSSLAAKSYLSKRLRRFMTAQLPAYWLDGLERYRFRCLSILSTSALCVLALILIVGLLSVNHKDWKNMLHTRNSIASTIDNTEVLRNKAAAFSTAPTITAQRLKRLDLLRSLQPAGPDVLLATVSDAFEKHPDVSLNHISWFTVVADEEFQSQTQVAHRDQLSMSVSHSDYLSILITGNIDANSLSQQQAIFSEFKATLMSLRGVGDLVEEQTPVTQWRMPDSALAQQAGSDVDSFTLRFSLSDASS